MASMAWNTTALASDAAFSGAAAQLKSHIGKGKWTVVNIWAPNCPPCREEMPELVRFHDDHLDQAEVVGVAIGFPDFGPADSKQVDEFVADYLIEFTVIKADGSISWQIDSSELQGLPTTYVYTPQGELVARQVGAITRKLLSNFIEDYSRKNNLNKPGTSPSSH